MVSNITFFHVEQIVIVHTAQLSLYSLGDFPSHKILILIITVPNILYMYVSPLSYTLLPRESKKFGAVINLRDVMMYICNNYIDSFCGSTPKMEKYRHNG